MKPIPKFIYSRANQILMILFVPIFALIFINIYRPLDFDNIDDSLLSGLNISRELSIQLLALMNGNMDVTANMKIEGDDTVPARLVKYMTPINRNFNIIEP